MRLTHALYDVGVQTEIHAVTYLVDAGFLMRPGSFNAGGTLRIICRPDRGSRCHIQYPRHQLGADNCFTASLVPAPLPMSVWMADAFTLRRNSLCAAERSTCLKCSQ